MSPTAMMDWTSYLDTDQIISDRGDTVNRAKHRKHSRLVQEILLYQEQLKSLKKGTDEYEEVKRIIRIKQAEAHNLRFR